VQLTALRGLPLWIVGGHGRGVHDLSAGGDIRRGMSDRGLDPVLAKPLGVAGLAAV
jgi:hypothetical protein